MSEASTSEMPQQAHNKQEWEAQWNSLEKESAFLGAFLGWCRRHLVAKEVALQVKRHFAPQGSFVEAGCGTSEDSLAVAQNGRTLIGLDFSEKALHVARAHGLLNRFLCGDLQRLPFRDNSLDGIWNWGVMEHFPGPALRQVLQECARVLKPGGCCLFFWPWAFGPSAIIFGLLDWIRMRCFGKVQKLYIPEYSQLRSRVHAQSLMTPIFGNCRAGYSWRTGLVVMIVTAIKR